MRKLWEYPEEVQRNIVAQYLKKYGKLIGEMSSPHSKIYTFDLGEDTYPRYVVAKGIKIDQSMPEAEKKKFFARVLYEANNAYTIFHHPSIQRFFDLEIIYGVPFILSRKREATLRDVIAEGTLPQSEALSIAIQLVHALEYCRQRGLLCHQDLKPENIFIDFIPNHFSVPPEYPLRCRVHLADFELANAFLVLRQPYGSRPYMAPEQYQGIQDIPKADFSRIDIFAVGVILFEMLSGGIHPIGEQTSLIWPQPVGGHSRKWLREDPWKKWLKNGASLYDLNVVSNAQLRSIIGDCMRINSACRPTHEELESRLRDLLQQEHTFTFDTLAMTLDQFDGFARESQVDGWPYYEKRLANLNEAFSDTKDL